LEQLVGAGLGGGVGAAGTVRRVLGEALGVVEGEVAVHLVGGDVVKPGIGLASGLEEDERADEVGPYERRRVVERVVVVGLRRQVHDRVVGGDERLDRGGIGDVGDHQLHAVGREVGQRLGAGGVRQLVEHGDPGLGVLHEVAHEVGADESGSTGHEHSVHAPDPMSNGGVARHECLLLSLGWRACEGSSWPVARARGCIRSRWR
jgi:hypothetical protein